MRFVTVGTLIVASGLCVFAGCASKTEQCVVAPETGNKPGKVAVNTVCPIAKDDAADESVTVNYKGKTIAFCCKDCVRKFNAMDAKGKDEVLAFATTYAK